MVTVETRIKWNGANVRLVGPSFKKYDNLRIQYVGLKSIFARLDRGISSDDQPGKPLTKAYARFKAYARRKKPIRDLDLTGAFRANLKTRYADDRMAIAEPSTRMERIKGRAHRQDCLFSDTDKRTMMAEAEKLFKKQVNETTRASLNPLRLKRNRNAALRETYFTRSDT
jgi:hypothetical protein